MSRVPGIGSASVVAGSMSAGDGRGVRGEERLGEGGSRFDGSSGRRRERRASDGGEGASPRDGRAGGGGVSVRGERLFTLGGSSDEEEGVAMAPVSRESEICQVSFVV